MLNRLPCESEPDILTRPRKTNKRPRRTETRSKGARKGEKIMYLLRYEHFHSLSASRCLDECAQLVSKSLHIYISFFKHAVYGAFLFL